MRDDCHAVAVGNDRSATSTTAIVADEDDVGRERVPVEDRGGYGECGEHVADRRYPIAARSSSVMCVTAGSVT